MDTRHLSYQRIGCQIGIKKNGGFKMQKKGNPGYRIPPYFGYMLEVLSKYFPSIEVLKPIRDITSNSY